MKLLSYRTAWGGASIGAIVDDMVADLPLLSAHFRPGEAFPSTMLGLIGQWERLRPILEELLAQAPDIIGEKNGEGRFIPEGKVNFLPPIPYPPKNIMCQGVNYKEHAEEGVEALTLSTDSVYVEQPVIFTKPHTALIGHRGEIIHHDATEALDYEGELGVVIGRTGKNITPEKVYEYIFGYTVANDTPARDRQRIHKQAFKGKGMDSFCPMGPYLVPKDYFGDPMNVMLRTWVNGELRQESSTSLMIHNIPTLISVLSLGMTLEPGDIFLTGTPSGVGYARETPTFLQPDDVVEIEIEGLGKLKSTVVAPSN
ncbi:MAG: fumarylacetoacetate hydrolase family protein [Nitrospinaceae bacterium]|jgi:2-keto-4-pentenoate hydratase/2-oxohepta-3-ene-1,7-dioic acid hydratase in catechol pathway|nr:fumarylacetoacetate hydrolase family protein [Nitrospinaceae bacterium]MBT3434446.1 fumarylacetoacetate hydrolase family protein [Nitrospinaceae bacterium]MBT3822106.1 fumarylacetoacetate hydrolase family protein [Nitrospinaceae bacterium]MBT4092567.1 fumarylacetoacetate hydrolase family protein [Nitrospinaceae bacterium]MBT4428884.1 fumarylacetoacetate hydrolase family protein [Nitrospinaceae bacterium]